MALTSKPTGEQQSQDSFYASAEKLKAAETRPKIGLK